MEHDLGAAAGLFEPGIHFPVGALAGDRLLDAIAIVFEVDGLAGVGGFRRRLHHLVEIILNVRAGHLDAGLKTHLDEQQQRALPEQQVLDILVGDAVIRQCALICFVLRKVRLFEGFERRRHLGGGGNRVAADFKFTPDFAPSTPTIFDAYGNYRYAPWAQLRAGKFKTPEGLEQLQADINTSFNERSLVTDLVPNRDVGLQFWGDINGGVLSYAAGIFNGVGDSRNSSNSAFENEVEFAGRLFAQPFKNSDITALQGLGFGIAGTSQNGTSSVSDLPNTTGGTLPGYSTDGQQQFFAYNPSNRVVTASGEHWRLSPQGYYYYGPLSLLGEYAISHQGVRSTSTTQPTQNATLNNTAWEITGGWVLTGENASFAGVTPLHPFDPHAGQWGAFQVVARYAELNIDNNAFPYFANPGTSASAAQAWSAGLNWFLNKNIRMNASFSHTTFTGGGGTAATAPSTVTRQAENVFFTRIQLAF